MYSSMEAGDHWGSTPQGRVDSHTQHKARPDPFPAGMQGPDRNPHNNLEMDRRIREREMPPPRSAYWSHPDSVAPRNYPGSPQMAARYRDMDPGSGDNRWTDLEERVRHRGPVRSQGYQARIEPHMETSHPSSSNGFGRPVAKPDRFDGKEVLSAYLQHFTLCATLNGWNDTQKAQFLAVSLAGEARQVINGLDLDRLRDYRYLIAALQARFDPVGRTELHRVQLKNRVRRSDESLSELADNIRILVERVFGDLLYPSKDKMARDHFIDALNDVEMRTRILQMRTVTLEEAVAAGVELEALQNAEKERFGPARRIREVNVENPDNSAVLSKMVADLIKRIDQLQLPDNGRDWRRNGTTRADKECYNCGEKGHFRVDCTKPRLNQGNRR